MKKRENKYQIDSLLLNRDSPHEMSGGKVTKQLFSNIVDTIHKPIKSNVLISKIKKVLS